MMEGLSHIIISKSKRLLVYCFAFLFGVALCSIIDKRFDFLYVYIALFAVASWLILFWSNSTYRFIACICLALVLGSIRYQIAFPLTAHHVSNANGEKVSLIGHVTAEPDVRMDSVRYIVETEKIGEAEDVVTGRVYVKSGLYPRYNYGDVLSIDCNLKAPEPIEDFAYDKHLARYGVFSICEGAKMKRIGTGEGNALFRGVLSLKAVVAERINTLWHEPYASFMAGLLYGYRGGLGQLNELFSRTGVTHIVAISGYNITLIATILVTLCINLYIPRKKAFWLVVVGICVFLIFAGLSASVVRAGIMGILVLLAKQLGRMSRIGNVLVLTAVIMTLQNPFILIYDAGFQLSFLSTVGLVYLSPHLGVYIDKFPEAFGLRDSLVSTLSATIMTLPLILFQFGRLSVVAVPVNMLILWIIPFIMILGFFAVVLSFVYAPIASVLAWVAWSGMFYIVSTVTWFASIPFAAVDMHIPLFLMVVFYMCFVALYMRKVINKHA